MSTSWKEDLRNARTVKQRCTFGDKEQLQALAMGEMSLHLKVQGKEAPIKVTLKDVLWIPAIPWRLSSTGIRRDGGDFVNSGTKKSYLPFRKGEPKIPLADKLYILTLSGSVQGNVIYEASAHSSFANKQETASSIERMTRHLGAH